MPVTVDTRYGRWALEDSGYVGDGARRQSTAKWPPNSLYRYLDAYQMFRQVHNGQKATSTRNPYCNAVSLEKSAVAGPRRRVERLHAILPLAQDLTTDVCLR